MMTSTIKTNKRKVFALRIGNYVEFRTSRFPLKALVSKLTKPVEQTQIEYGKLVQKSVPFIMKQVTYSGGRVLGHCHATHFNDRFGVGVPMQYKYKVMGSEQAKLVLDPNWRDKHLW